MPLTTMFAGAGVRGLGWGSAAAESLDGMVLIYPTSVDKTGVGSSASIGGNGAVTASSCATVSINGVFSADYENYIINIRYTLGATNPWQLRLRSAGTDNTGTSTYTCQTFVLDGTSATAQRPSGSSFEIGRATSGTAAGLNILLCSPFLTEKTTGKTVTVGNISSASMYDVALSHNQSTSYDGFTLIGPGSASITGLIAVYGLEN